ncbi:hypothetical protein [Bacillus marasmi]|uniref:hypothetical protein n=1 Tax=Bacillus marasmi TaxID=1926279 RepID=UPI0011C7822F|nr:hypothetical protein [Bacillus marasmi]
MGEKTMDLFNLSHYQNRQVVLNYYDEEDFLWKRDGFEFDSLEVSIENLSFIKRSNNVLIITFKDYPYLLRDNDYQDYFILQSNNFRKRIELYFPH